MANRTKESTADEMEVIESVESAVAVEAESPFSSAPKKSAKKPTMLKKLLALVFVVGAVTSGYLYFQLQKLSQDPAAANLAQINEAVERVGQLMVLPEGETPTLATINDTSKLEGQPFFVNAKVGDQVLLYPGAMKAILYDPTANLILEVSSINIGQ